jgi:hypothetical protein
LIAVHGDEVAVVAGMQAGLQGLLRGLLDCVDQ